MFFKTNISFWVIFLRYKGKKTFTPRH